MQFLRGAALPEGDKGEYLFVNLLYFWIYLCYNKGNKEKRGEDGACQPYKGGNDDEEA